VIGTPHPKWGEQVTAVVVVKAGVCIDATTISEYAGTRLSGFKKPRRVEFVAALPRNAGNKVQTRVLREQFNSAPSPAGSVDESRAGPLRRGSGQASRRPRKDGASSGRTDIVENNNTTVRPEEPPFPGGVSKGVLARKSTDSSGRGLG
jgi:hypothetical protein